MIDIERYLICGGNLSHEIAILESYIDSIMIDIAIESASSDNEPDGSRIRNAYKNLGTAIKSKDKMKIQNAQNEVRAASSEIDHKVKDPAKKKKIIMIASLAAAGVALLVGSVAIANKLKGGAAKSASEIANIASSLPKVKTTDQLNKEVIDTKKNPPWGEGSFDDFMKEPNGKLVFK